MDIERKIELITRSPIEEVVTMESLREILETYEHPKQYIGFEVSGRMHIGMLLTVFKIKDFLEAKVKPTIFIADYHAWINEKLGGDLEKIKEIAKGYFKHTFISFGLNEENVNYVLASELYNDEFWKNVLKLSMHTTVKRVLRTVTIMGRKESDTLNSSAVIYPLMQAIDIHELDVQIAHGGMDQRKVHMLAKELLPKLFGRKFVALHHHIIPSLHSSEKMNAEFDQKMSKSKPESAIFIDDNKEEVNRKIRKAYCPEREIENNPVMEYARYLCFRDSFKIERPLKFGGDVEFSSFDELAEEYQKGNIHPVDLKNAVAAKINELLEPSRRYFEKHPEYIKQKDEIIASK